ncbi:MAG: nitrate reductase molybdenum cofactor assembly chaperone [Planctomycetota bacterium]|jgi:nitrate reductase molybdenum cofactor assembly chaperone
MNISHYELLADLFGYPDETFPDKVERVNTFLKGKYPQAAELLAPFCEHLPVDDLHAMQELFTRSFDVQSVTTLDVGYVLFGDDYKRGELLANLTRENREAGNECGNELPDHLPVMLRLLPKLEDEELVEELIQQLIGPAIKKMIGEFQPGRLVSKDKMYKKHHKTVIATSNTRTIYCQTLEALLAVVSSDFDLVERAMVDRPRGFLPMVKTELELEPAK